MPTLTVRRDRGWSDKLRKYRVIVDGVVIGQLAEGGELRHTLDEGTHVIEARIDWCGSPTTQFDAAGDAVMLVRSALRGWRVLLTLFYVLFNPRGYLTVEPESASKSLQPLALGPG